MTFCRKKEYVFINSPPLLAPGAYDTIGNNSNHFHEWTSMAAVIQCLQNLIFVAFMMYGQIDKLCN